MKLISLNTWGGRLSEAIDCFIQQHASGVDIFCFQEVHKNGSSEANESVGERPHFFSELQSLLPGFTGFFAEQVAGVGLATFIRDAVRLENVKSVPILYQEEVGHLQTSGGMCYYPRIMQVIQLKNPHIAIYNFHGIPGNEKKDTPEREIQMRRLREILGQNNVEKILVGDFNLSPDTEAVRDLEKVMRNLVMEGNFKTTRSQYYDKKETMPFADYTFVTSGIRVKRFEVMSDEVSDHSPMYLDFE